MDDPNEDRQLPDSPGPSGQGNVRRLRDKVTYYETLSSGRVKVPSQEIDDGDEASGIIDVQAFEQRLCDERNRRTLENSPRIEVRLRSTPQASPARRIDSPNRSNVNVKVNIFTQQQPAAREPRAGSSDSMPESFEESIERSYDGGELTGNSRVFTFEKITLKKTVREVTVLRQPGTSIETVTSRSERFSRTPSEERVFHDDSAYHTHHSNVHSSVASKSSSATSLHGRFPSEEHVHGRTLHDRNFNDSQTWSSNAANGSFVSGSGGVLGRSHGSTVVAEGYLSNRRQQTPERHSGTGDETDEANTSLDWYNEYRAHSFQTAAAKMSFKRTNSQYDTHIKEIRGTIVYSFLVFFSYLKHIYKFCAFVWVASSYILPACSR